MHSGIIISLRILKTQLSYSNKKFCVQFLTLTKWWVVPVIWLPVVCWLFAKSIKMGHTVQEVVLMALFGVLVWTLIEYTLHRFLFHVETKSYW